jgi:glycosyltransferase involved in cell wall biosynthesis
LKILFIGRYNESSALTGPEKAAKRIFNKCSNVFETVFLTYFFDGSRYNIFTKLFGKKEITETGNRKIIMLGLVRILIFMFKFKPDIIHIITFERFAAVSFFYKRFSKTKFYYSIHGIAAFENSVNPDASAKLKSRDLRFEKKYFLDSDKLIFLSQRSVETAQKYFEFDKRKVEIIPNGIDIIFHQIGKGKKINFKNKLKIVFVGDANKKEKGFRFLKNCLDKIVFGAEVFVIGDQYKLKTDTNKGISFSFIDRMKTEMFARFLSDKDIFISASSYEQFSITSVEAMAAGLVTIVTEETGMSTYIENNKNGFTVKYGDANELVNILNKLQNNREIISRVSAEAKKIYFKLSWELVYIEYKKLYG